MERNRTKTVQWTPHWEHYLISPIGQVVQWSVYSEQKRAGDQHSPCEDSEVRGEDLKDYVMRFNREAVLIPNLRDVVAYMAFLN